MPRMRAPPLVVLAACAAGCFFQPTEAPQADSTSDSTASPSTTDPTGDTGLVCEPGTAAPCACPNGVGEQICGPLGQGYLDCVCPVDPATTTSTTLVTTGDPDTDTSTTTGTTSPLDTTTTDASTTIDTTGTDSTTTGTDATTDGSTTEAMGCMSVDPEPNDTSMTAAMHLEIECDGLSHNFTGTLDGETDVDWHTYHASWPQAPCPADIDPPMAHKLTATGPLRLCVFPNCNAMDFMEDIVCGVGSMPVMEMIGPGCCGTGDVDFAFDCEGSGNESAELLLRLDSAPADSCVSYGIEYLYALD
jgi:hypothetical protein